MERYFIVRRGNVVLFIKTNTNSMWEITLAKHTYTAHYNKNMESADIFRNCVNEILKTNYSQGDLLSLSPNAKIEYFKGE